METFALCKSSWNKEAIAELERPFHYGLNKSRCNHFHDKTPLKLSIMRGMGF